MNRKIDKNGVPAFPLVYVDFSTKEWSLKEGVIYESMIWGSILFFEWVLA